MANQDKLVGNPTARRIHRGSWMVALVTYMLFGIADAVDGTSFVRASTSPQFDLPFLDDLSSFYALSASEPALVIVDGVHYLFFTGMLFDDEGRMFLAIGLATSNDGTSWMVRDEPVFEADPESWDSVAVTTPSVIHDGEKFVMAYTGVAERVGGVIHVESGAIGLATSSDGRTWTRLSDQPIVTAGIPGSWSETGVWGPALVLDESTYSLYYAGVSVGECGETQAGIGLARPE